MKKLKTILQSNIITIFIFLITVFYILFYLNNKPESKYTKNENIITGYIYECDRKEDKIVLKVKGKENILVNYYDDFKCELGSYIKAYGEIKKPEKNTNFYLFNYQNYLLTKKINYIFKADKIEKINTKIPFIYQIKNYLNKHIENYKSKPYLEALVLGKDDNIKENVIESYQTNGISHLLAISGAQITLFSCGLLFILSKLFSKNTSYLFTIMFLLFYLFITNFQSSILRAVAFFIILTINKQFELKISTLKLLIITLCTLLIINPYLIYSLGFILSFTVSFFLILFKGLINKYQNYFSKTLVISLIAFLSSAPIIINSFFKINLLSPIINLYFVPLVTFIIYPLALLTFIFRPLDNIFLNIVTIMEKASLKLSNIDILNLSMSHINIIFFIIYYLIIIFILYNWQKGRNYVIVFFIILLIHHNINYLNPYSTLTMIDVGQGDSFLLKLKHNKANILIDTGGIASYDDRKPYDIAKNILIPYLNAEGVNKLDYLIITHGDFDHGGMAKNLIKNFKIKHIILNRENNNLEKEIIKKFKGKITNISEGIIKIENITLNFLNGLNTYDENKASLIIYTNIENRNILLMGDATKESENYILNTYNLPKMDILKVGHHGSNTSTSKKLIKKISPKISLISAGKNNIYGHPHQETLKKLKNSDVYITKKDGAVKINLNNFTIKTAR